MNPALHSLCGALIPRWWSSHTPPGACSFPIFTQPAVDLGRSGAYPQDSLTSSAAGQPNRTALLPLPFLPPSTTHAPAPWACPLLPLRPPRPPDGEPRPPTPLRPNLAAGDVDGDRTPSFSSSTSVFFSLLSMIYPYQYTNTYGTDIFLAAWKQTLLQSVVYTTLEVGPFRTTAHVDIARVGKLVELVCTNTQESCAQNGAHR